MAHLCQGLQQNKHTTTVVNNHSSTEYTLLLLWSEYALLLLPYLNVINLPPTHQTYLLCFTQVTATPNWRTSWHIRQVQRLSGSARGNSSSHNQKTRQTLHITFDISTHGGRMLPVFAVLVRLAILTSHYLISGIDYSSRQSHQSLRFILHRSRFIS